MKKKCYLVNDAGAIEVENNYFATSNEIIDSGKDNQKLLKEELGEVFVGGLNNFTREHIL